MPNLPPMPHSPFPWSLAPFLSFINLSILILSSTEPVQCSKKPISSLHQVPYYLRDFLPNCLPNCVPICLLSCLPNCLHRHQFVRKVSDQLDWCWLMIETVYNCWLLREIWFCSRFTRLMFHLLYKPYSYIPSFAQWSAISSMYVHQCVCVCLCMCAWACVISLCVENVDWN